MLLKTIGAIEILLDIENHVLLFYCFFCFFSFFLFFFFFFSFFFSFICSLLDLAFNVNKQTENMKL